MRTKAAGCDLGVLAVFALALLSPMSLRAENKPVIGVEFQIEAQDFRKNLYNKIENVQKDLASLIAGLSTDKHEFLAWRPMSELKDRSQLAAVLHVSLTQEKSSGGVGGAIMLRFSANAGANGFSFNCRKGTLEAVGFGRVKDLDRTLFTPLEPQHTGEPEALRKSIRDQLDRSDFRDALGKVFASHIPICHGAKPGPKDLVTIYFEQSDLEVDEKSKMQLRLCSHVPEGTRTGAVLELEAAITSGSYRDGDPTIQARVSGCLFGALEQAPCKAQIPLMFHKPMDRSLDVFMTDFVGRYPNTQDSRATIP